MKQDPSCDTYLTKKQEKNWIKTKHNGKIKDKRKEGK